MGAEEHDMLSPQSAMLLLGPTGSGKSPLGDRCEKHGLWGHRCVHFDFGAQLRRVAGGAWRPAGLDDADVAFVKRVLEEGVLLEDAQFDMARCILEQFVRDRELGSGDHVVLNGLPRHEGQARALDAWAQVDAVVYLDAGVDVVLGRITTNVGGDRAGRTDDERAAIARRVATFRERTEPLVAYYRGKGVRIVRIEVAVDQTPDMMFARLESEQV
jgi:adenylate kinase family enzyme